MKYRKEIDGLRSIAVIPVVLFHAGISGISGGYVGVDIFFVISGYLITTLIVKELQEEKFSIIEFYERRARRILPALFLVVLCTIPFAYLWLLPTDLKKFFLSIASVATFTSNILFYKESGYFETEAELKPLIHTWSLGIEEQFYLFFPLALILIWRFKKVWMFPILVATSIMSLLMALILYPSNPNAAFYLFPTRIWELLLGSVTAISLNQSESIKVNKNSKEFAGFLGLALIGYAVFTFNAKTPDPSLYTLIPTVGAALIIIFAESDTYAGKFLGLSVFVGVGLISYSVYLWHQPLIAFAKQRQLGELSNTTKWVLINASLILGYLSLRFVESPFRNRKKFSQSQIFKISTLLLLILLIISYIGFRFNSDLVKNSSIAGIFTIKTVDNSRCHTTGRRTAIQIKNGDVCTLGANVKPSFVVIGDSHAAAIFETLGDISKENGIAFEAYSGAFCAPLINFHIGSGKNDCLETTHAALNRIANSPEIKKVILVAEWPMYTKGFRVNGNGDSFEKFNAENVTDEIGTSSTPKNNYIVVERALRKTIKMLLKNGKEIYVLSSTPEFKVKVIKTIAYLYKNSQDISMAPKILKSEYDYRNQEVFDIFSRINKKEAEIIYIQNLFCDEIYCNSISGDGKILFEDTNHVTEYGSYLITKRIFDVIGNNKSK